jgi:hypothetical protein
VRGYTAKVGLWKSPLHFAKLRMREHVTQVIDKDPPDVLADWFDLREWAASRRAEWLRPEREPRAQDCETDLRGPDGWWGDA